MEPVAVKFIIEEVLVKAYESLFARQTATYSTARNIQIKNTDQIVWVSFGIKCVDLRLWLWHSTVSEKFISTPSPGEE